MCSERNRSDIPYPRSVKEGGLTDEGDWVVVEDDEASDSANAGGKRENERDKEEVMIGRGATGLDEEITACLSTGRREENDMMKMM